MGSADDTVSEIINDILEDVISRSGCDIPMWMKSASGANETLTPIENNDEDHRLENDKDRFELESLTLPDETYLNEKHLSNSPSSEHLNDSALDEFDESEHSINCHDEFQIIRVSSVTKKSANRRKKSGLSGV